MARLGALTEFDFNHFDLRVFSLLGKALRIKMAIAGAATKIAASQFPHQIAAVLTVIAADAALTGVMIKIALGRAQIEGTNGIGRQRAETHGGDIKDRGGVGLAAAGAADRHAEAGRIGYRYRTHGMADAFIAGLIDVQLSAEGFVTHLVFGAAIDQRALSTGKRDLSVIFFQ
ncbi:Uncharacterised protein [Serratia quinivorans]|nr:Uncharacterised protein [Serratia quinivorans]